MLLLRRSVRTGPRRSDLRETQFWCLHLLTVSYTCINSPYHKPYLRSASQGAQKTLKQHFELVWLDALGMFSFFVVVYSKLWFKGLKGS